MSNTTPDLDTVLSVFQHEFLVLVEEKYGLPYSRETWEDLSTEEKMKLIHFLTQTLQSWWEGAKETIDDYYDREKDELSKIKKKYEMIKGIVEL